MSHQMTTEVAIKLLSVAWPGIVLYVVMLGVVLWATIDHYRRCYATWRGQGWAMTLPRRSAGVRHPDPPE